MHEEREVRCRCGERVFVVPSLTARCPQCGRRLFRKCQCGALVERMMNKCPHCGADYERTYAEARPPLRLRRILGAGLTGAFIFALLGYWSHKALSRLSPNEVNNLTSHSPHQEGGNILVLTLKGLLLLVTDLFGVVGRTLRENPILLVFAIFGFLIAAIMTSRRQQLSWSRLKRHLRRKWKQFSSR
ncbi:MAG: hypothetical protein ACK4I8_06735 [Armatimonadota bacterium]